MRFVLVGILCISFLFLKGQRSNEYWTSLSGQTKLFSNYKLSAEYGYRFENSVNYTSLGEIGLNRKLPFKIKANVSYRYTWKIQDEFKLKKIHRPSLSFSKKWKLIKRTKFSVRSKMQWDYSNRWSVRNNDLLDFAWRNKFKLKRKLIKRGFLNLSYEIFAFEDLIWGSRNRYAASFEKGITKKDWFTIGYMYESAFNDYKNSNVCSFSYFRKF